MNHTAFIANSLWFASNLPALIRFRQALACPAEAQRQLLRRYLARNSGSAYGKAHGLAGIRTYKEFARQVPLINYDDLEPWIARIMRGECQVLTCEPVTHLIPTSGSGGPRKLIPFTSGLQNEFNRAIGPWIADLYCRHPSLAAGPAYWSITPAVQGRESALSVVPIGFNEDSTYLGGTRKRLVDLVMAVPSEVRLAANMEQFRYLTLLCLLRREDLRLISVWHPSFLSLLMDALPDYWGSLLNDIHGGTCKDSRLLPSTIRDTFKLRPLPPRARRLRGADPRVPDTLWPSLKVISCWSDGPAQSAAEDLQRRFPNVLIQPKGLLATEAFVTIPFGDSRPVAVCSHFFEFVDGQGKIHLAHELRDGETYEVVVTTGGGLWRYCLRDRIQASGFADKTPSLRFIGRNGSVSDRFGEKLSEAFVAQAIREALADLPAQPRFVLLAPDADLPGCRYTLYVEGDVPSGLPTRLDTSLRRNPHYAWCRELGQLQAIRLFQIKAGGHRAFVARELSRGRRLGEIKPCYLSNLLGWSEWFKAQEPDGATRKPGST